MAAFFVLSSHYCGSVSVCAHKNPLWFNISNTLILSSKKHVLWSKVLRSPASIFSYTSINEILRDSNIQSALVLFIVLNIPWLYFYHLFFLFFLFFYHLLSRLLNLTSNRLLLNILSIFLCDLLKERLSFWIEFSQFTYF